ncbi:unnamed protein product [Lactuca saligna]|uniref:Uncharacterized protein n=1 Tax=Lactuca saligna TaxID=75948 RepID=A0AA35Y7R0_LACSI|nr:unnamed protein product [Lactuca saligna]
MENGSNTSKSNSFKQQPLPSFFFKSSPLNSIAMEDVVFMGPSKVKGSFMLIVFDNESLTNATKKEPVTHTSMVGHLNDSQKNRVESWKDKQNKKKKSVAKVAKEVQIHVNHQMGEKQGSTKANGMQPLSQIVTIPKSQITPYRVVIIVDFSYPSSWHTD